MSFIEKAIQEGSKLAKKFSSIPKIVEFLNDELPEKVFKDKVDEFFEMGKKVVDEVINRI